MAVLSNNGRLISSLPIKSSTIDGSDEVLIQTDGVTKRTTFSNIQSSVLFNFLNPFSDIAQFTNINNKISGSFFGTLKGNVTGNLTGDVTGGLNKTITAGDGLSGGGTLNSNISFQVNNTVVRTSGNQTIGGIKTYSSTLNGNINSTGVSTFNNIDINGGSIDGTSVGSSVQSTVKGTQITASVRFLGSLNGDLYTSNGNIVLENGTSANLDGNVPSAYFYGTSSYAMQSLTSAYSLSSVATNGLPIGGGQYQVLTKKSGTDYDSLWSTPITASTPGVLNYVTVWDGATSLKTTDFRYDGVKWIFVEPVQVNQNVTATSFTGSLNGVVTSPQTTKIISNVSPGDDQVVLNGDIYPNTFLMLSSSGYVTMSLKQGQSCAVLIQSAGSGYDVLEWSGSLDGGNTANTNILWPNGTQPSITSGDLKKDLFTFINVSNFIVGYAYSDVKGKI
jgi:hypothetical protein